MFKQIKEKIIKKNITNKFNKPIYGYQSASNIITNLFEENNPFFVSRLGTTELAVLVHYLKSENKYIFPDNLKENISTLSGFFPPSNEMLNRFCIEMLKCLKNIDILGVRFEKSDKQYFENENIAIQLMKTNIQFIQINELTPIFVDNPWTMNMENKRVLVIHPFEKSIKKQYTKNKLLFKNHKILPDFTLLTLKSVQSLSVNKDLLKYDTWFDALEDMCEKIYEIDFDVALIGAGAYGMFLGDYCKKIGKSAIHIGGGLQVLFGIKGKRWDNLSSWNKKVYNTHWIYPSDSEKPLGYLDVEQGCYW